MVQRPCCSPVFETTTCCVSNKTCLCFSCWRQTPLLFCQSRRAACLCKLSSRVSSRWQDAVVWTRAGAWKWRQEEKTSTETWREEEGERTATEILSSSLFFFLVSQQIPACARPSPVQVMPPASRRDRADTCASVLGATWAKTASWSQDSASQTGSSFFVEQNNRSFLIIIMTINNQYGECCHSPYSPGGGTVERELD